MSPDGVASTDTMNELDENGWGHIHHAAYRGFVKSVERFVAAGEEQVGGSTDARMAKEWPLDVRTILIAKTLLVK